VIASLTSAPVGDVLDRLYTDAERSHAAFRGERRQQAGGPGGPGGRPAHRGGDEREFFARAKNLYMAVSRQTGTLLYLLARTHRARAVVEFGTSFGVSTLCLAAAVKDNGGGLVIGTEFEPGKVAATRRAAEEAGLGDIVEVREGDALKTLARDLPATVDLLFLDGAKSMYLDVLGLLEGRLGPGAVVVADNASRGAGYLDHVRSSPAYLSSAVDGDVEVSIRTGGAEERSAAG